MALADRNAVIIQFLIASDDGKDQFGIHLHPNVVFCPFSLFSRRVRGFLGYRAADVYDSIITFEW